MRNIGIDIGWTIKGNRGTGDKESYAPHSMETIKRIKPHFDNIFLISKCNSAQKEHVEEWLYRNGVLEELGIDRNNLYFCFERRDKAIFVKALNITHFIDDRAEVLVNLPGHVFKVLYNPDPEEYSKQLNTLSKMENYTITYDWSSIPTIFNL